MGVVAGLVGVVAGLKEAEDVESGEGQGEPFTQPASLVGLAGLIAVLVYILANALGSLIHPHYSQLANSVSELTSSKAPHRLELAIAFALYNLALAAFALGLYALRPGRHAWVVGAALLLTTAVAGVGMIVWFPQDTTGTPATSGGAVHIALAGIASVASVVVAVLFGHLFRRDAWWRSMSVFSYGAAILILLTAPLAVIGTARSSHYMGLFERFTIGAFLLWILGVSLYALGHRPCVPRRGAATA